VIHLGGIVERVALVDEGLLFAPMAQDPSFLKPPHVAHFPKGRVDDGKTRSEKLVVTQIGDQIECPGATLGDDGDELRRGEGSGGAHPILVWLVPFQLVWPVRFPVKEWTDELYESHSLSLK
jgi:hypothetical protein